MRTMELKQLEYFLAVAQELHFTKASEKVGISQPSLSQQIRALEAEIGVPLFDRIGKKTALTEAGRILRGHAQRVFHELSQARAAISELQGLQRGKLTIGALLTVVNYLLPPAILAFHRQYPHIELSVLGLRTGDIRSALLDNQLDMGIVFLPVEDEEFETLPLVQEELCLVVPSGHALTEKRSAPLEVLKETPSVLLPQNYYLRQLIDQHCETAGFSVKPSFEMTTMESIVNMVASGIGVTVLPKPYVDFIQNGKIAAVPFASPITRQIGIIYRADKYMCAATRVFLENLIGTAKRME
ncbi:LysR family transcriptional regulator [Brevibacillus borstelensis]|uniref:LysR family transcriptional regulator n=1 Tax=Brevibacillus borstelensis TaxID=45462 RepID=UPI003CEE444A